MKIKVKILSTWLEHDKIAVKFSGGGFKEEMAYARSIQAIPRAIQEKIAELKADDILAANAVKLEGKTIEV